MATTTVQENSDHLIKTLTAQLRSNHLQPFQRVELAMQLEVLRPALSRLALSQLAGLGESTFQRGKAVAKTASDAEKTDLRQGKIAIKTVYKRAKHAMSSPATTKADQPTLTPARVISVTTKPTRVKPKPKPSDMPYAESIRREVRQRVEGVCDRALTLDEWAKHWEVHTDIARRYLREALMVGSVTRTENRYTITLSSEIVELTKWFRSLRAEVTRRRKENHDRRGASRWDPVEVNLAEQRALLDWIESQLDKVLL